MIAWVVIYRRHPHHSASISSPLRTLRLCVQHSDSFLPSFPLISHLPYVLPSSVAPNPFVCHSYENCRGVYQQFPFRNARHSPLITRHFSQLLSFHTLAHSFALTKNSTSFLSIASALFPKNHPGWGGGSTRHNPVQVVSCA